MAILAAAALLISLNFRAESRLRRFSPALAALNLPEEARGVVLQRRIFERPHCLPIYGSSELSIVQPTRPDLFFHRKGQGFDVCLIGNAGNRCLPILQELASLGEVVRGRSIAIFLSPTWFLPGPAAQKHDHTAHNQFAAIFSPLQAGRLAVDSPLKPEIKRQVAARLLSFDPVIKTRSPLLDVALASLREPVWTRRWLFVALKPLLELQNQIFIFQERCHWLDLTRDRAALRPPASAYRPRHKHLDWAQLDRELDRMEAKHGQTTFYSRGPALEKSPELRRALRLADYPDQDADYLRRMQASPEWGDLELLLKAAKELGVHLLLIGQPINGLFSDHQGVTAQARRVYYRRVSQIAATYRVPLRDFSAYEEDRTFFMDIVHPSAEAWVHYDQTLAEFFDQKRL